MYVQVSIFALPSSCLIVPPSIFLHVACVLRFVDAIRFLVVHTKVPACVWYVWRKKCKTRRRKVLLIGCLMLLLTAPLPANRRLAKLALWNR